MEACPKHTTNLTGVYKIACNRYVRVDRSALAFGLGVGRSPRRRYCYQLCHTMYLVLGINFMDAYDVYQ